MKDKELKITYNYIPDKHNYDLALKFLSDHFRKNEKEILAKVVEEEMKNKRR